MENLKQTVSEYINLPADQITDNTAIDRSAVSSSIVLHRMYAKLAEKGFSVDNYWNIKTFGSLQQLNKGEQVLTETNSSFDADIQTKDETDLAVGIDIEEISEMPRTADFREDDFYKMNFSDREISYCILQVDPYASFAGLYALKEAIVKCDNKYRKQPFNSIAINHSDTGKPGFKDFEVSLSHSKDVAVAIALKMKPQVAPDHTPSSAFPEIKSQKGASYNLFAIIALVISTLALLVSVMLWVNNRS